MDELEYEKMDKVERRKYYVENISPHQCPMCSKPTITKGQYCSVECGMDAAQGKTPNQ